MGLLCVVTNCGEGTTSLAIYLLDFVVLSPVITGMDYQAIGKNLNGLCQTGAWGCFDE
jgi:dynein heavy chain, axonemal